MSTTEGTLAELAVTQLDDVDRVVVVGEATPAGVPLRATLSQVYPTDAEDLWQACTTADRLVRWFAPVSGDLALGGRYQVEGNAGGTVTSCVPPRSFEITWEFGDTSSTVTVEIDEIGSDRARLTLTHGGDVAGDFWQQYGPGATGVGWELGFLGLAQHLRTGTDVPAESTSWSTTGSARDFMAGSVDRWNRAVVAAGADETWAAEAGARTVAFYTGG